MSKFTRVAFDSEKNLHVLVQDNIQNNTKILLEVGFRRDNGIAPLNGDVEMDEKRWNSLTFTEDAQEIANVVESLKETTKTLIDLF